MPATAKSFLRDYPTPPAVSNSALPPRKPTPPLTKSSKCTGTDTQGNIRTQHQVHTVYKEGNNTSTREQAGDTEQSIYRRTCQTIKAKSTPKAEDNTRIYMEETSVRWSAWEQYRGCSRTDMNDSIGIFDTVQQDLTYCNN